ncbi:acetate--CoA ligase family protein [Yoonia sp. 208BN28-4]|uniref:acetate--CoA ligase family protein n=1 Tax=Yoonia sp. 208BN28-4 TaxID=3126505 RepID=UPI0030A993BD
MRDLSRLLRPASIAIIGGGAWCHAVVQQLEKAGFSGDVYRVHPSGDGGAFASVADLPQAPDAAFVGVNRDATLDVIADLSAKGAGGAVCFASGFAEVADGQDRNAALLQAAGDMPILGPNCYGFINALDGALLWPDQHGCVPCDRGVAILTQSSNIAINLTMQARGLPLAYVFTCGNQAQTTQAEIAMALLDDPRVTAIGLHVEGFGDLAQWQAFARAAHAKGVRVVLLKVGTSLEAQQATVSHTASLAGSDAGARALMARFGFATVADLDDLIETLKILHVAGPLASNRIATISCSGGEASLAADIAAPLGLVFPPLTDRQTAALSDALGPKVALANPLDYHTYIWRDTTAMTHAFSAMLDPDLALVALIVDFPRKDRCDPTDWRCVIDAALAMAQRGGPVAVIASLPELMPEDVAEELMAGGVIPLNGLGCGLRAVAAAALCAPVDLSLDLVTGPAAHDTITLTEAGAKHALAEHGLAVPRHTQIGQITEVANLEMHYPVVLKAEGVAHKSDRGGVALNLMSEAEIIVAAHNMDADRFLIEEMIPDPVAELLVGVTHDPAHGLVLTVGAGGVLTELLSDTQSLLLPASADSVRRALSHLKCYRILQGFRGKPAADIDAIIAAIMVITGYALANADTVQEVEVNPLICTAKNAIAADALIRKNR